MILFRYDAALLERYPALRGGVILAENLHNGPTPAPALEAYLAEQQAVLRRIGETPLSDLPTLAAWRRAFSAFGVKPTQYRSAAEALLRRLTKQGDIPSLNLLVDLGNLVSIRYALPIAVFDRRAATGPITVRFAQGDESFTDLGTTEIAYPDPGEVIFVDEAKLVSARRWCWRQSEQSGAREDTTHALITIEGHHATAEQDVTAALADLKALLSAQVPGATLRSDVLSPSHPAFVIE
jgi:DNA/RNA-binding domain of Phe-tRNA-synthetase-like protein